MFVNTQMLTKRQLAKMQALFVFFACENFEKEPTAEKFVKLLDEAREFFLAIPNMQGNGISRVKKIFDDMTHAAVSNKDLHWNDFPLIGMQSAFAMAARDLVPETDLRLFLEHHCKKVGTDQFGCALILLIEFIKEVGEWLGLSDVEDIDVNVISVSTIGDDHDN